MREDTSTLSKKRIASAFSKDVRYYETHAIHQKKCALELASYFKEIPDGELLEIGCGTGFLTEEIEKKYPERALTAMDLSENMVAFCREKFPKAHFLQGDGEKLKGENRYAAIFSGMCLHWFLNPKKGLQQIRKALKKGGILYFSFPNVRSYPEWNYFPLNPFLSVGMLLEEFGNVEFHEIEDRQAFTSPLEFLREMKRLGTFAKLKNDHNNLKDLIKVAKYEKMSPITLTTRITIGYCYV